MGQDGLNLNRVFRWVKANPERLKDVLTGVLGLLFLFVFIMLMLGNPDITNMVSRMMDCGNAYCF